MNKPVTQLKVGEWMYLPNLDKLVKLDEKREVQQLELDNLCQGVLNYFILNPGRLISKEELLKEVWNITSVTDGRIARVISILRDALSDDVKAPTYIETINKRGYRFIAKVQEVDLVADSSAEQAVVKKRHRLYWFVGLTALLLIFLFTGWKVVWNGEPAEERVRFGRWASVTALDGFEYYTALSKDGRYLAFSHMKAPQELHKLMLLDLVTQEQRVLAEGDFESYGAEFNPDGTRLAYQRLKYKEYCEIRVISFSNDATKEIVSDEKLTDCGDESISSRLSWSPDGQVLLYTRAASQDKRMGIYKYDFLTQSTSPLILPTIEGYGDFSVRFSTNGKHIAFLRDVALQSVQLWTMDLTTNETSFIADLQESYPGTVVWSLDDTAVYFPSLMNTIEKVTLSKKQQKTVIVTNNRIQEVLLNPLTNEFLGSVGYYGSYFIRKHNNAALNQSSSEEVLFKSNRNESLIALNPKNSHSAAVVSERSGLPQIWLFDSTGSKQISSFSTKKLISNLTFSHSGQYLVALVDQSFWVYSENEGLKDIHKIKGPIRNVGRAQAPNNFYYSVGDKGRWQSYEYDAITGVSTVVSKGTDLYFTSPNGRYVLMRETQTNSLRLLKDGVKIPWPDRLVGGFAFESGIVLTDQGIYFRSTDDNRHSQVLMFNFSTGEVVKTGGSAGLFSHSFEVSPDEQFIYMVAGEGRDVDIANLVLEP